MKLLNVTGCQPPFTGGNVNRLTKLVEVQGMGLRTRVRLPSGPLDTVETNPCPISKIAVCRNIVYFVIPLQRDGVPRKADFKGF